MAYDLGEKESLGNREAEKDIQSLRRRKRKVAKKDRGFLGGVTKSSSGRGKGLGYVPKSKSGGHKMPKSGFGDMIGTKGKTYKATSFI